MFTIINGIRMFTSLYDFLVKEGYEELYVKDALTLEGIGPHALVGLHNLVHDGPMEHRKIWAELWKKREKEAGIKWVDKQKKAAGKYDFKPSKSKDNRVIL